MKHFNGCNQDLDLACFAKKKNGLQSKCRKCHSKYRRAHHVLNRDKYMAISKSLRDKLKQEVNEIKNVPCVDCKVKYPSWIMQFDHRNPSEKITEVGRIVERYNRKAVLEEIAKCDIVCANCHLDREYKRRNGILA